MFNKKRLVRVEVTLRHGDKDETDIKDIISILPGQKFHVDIFSYRISEGGTTVRTIDYRPGRTHDLEYFYQ